VGSLTRWRSTNASIAYVIAKPASSPAIAPVIQPKRAPHAAWSGALGAGRSVGSSGSMVSRYATLPRLTTAAGSGAHWRPGPPPRGAAVSQHRATPGDDRSGGCYKAARAGAPSCAVGTVGSIGVGPAAVPA